MNLTLKNNNTTVFENDTVKDVAYNVQERNKKLVIVTIDYMSTSDCLPFLGKTFSIEVKNGSTSIEKHDSVVFYKNKTIQNGNNVDTMLCFEIGE